MAKRLHLKVGEIRLVSSTPKVWPNAALGLPRLGEMAAMVRTPGQLIVLEAKRVAFLYTAGGKAVRFGGPVQLGGYSMLVTVAVPNEPNLNSDVYQVTMAGTNPRLIVPRVSRFAVQPAGEIVGVRRTSRSGHDLVYVALDGKEKVLRSAFDFGAYAFDMAGVRWAVCERGRLGGTWVLLVNSEERPLPGGAIPGRLAWQGNDLYAWTRDGQYVLSPGKEWEKARRAFVDDSESLMLNKSESLDVKNGPSGARVLRVWFTGDEKEVALIPGLEMASFRLVGGNWAFVVGKRSGEMAAYLVELSSGIVVPCLSGRYSGVQLCPFPAPGYPAVR